MKKKNWYLIDLHFKRVLQLCSMQWPHEKKTQTSQVRQVRASMRRLLRQTSFRKIYEIINKGRISTPNAVNDHCFKAPRTDRSLERQKDKNATSDKQARINRRVTQSQWRKTATKLKLSAKQVAQTRVKIHWAVKIVKIDWRAGESSSAFVRIRLQSADRWELKNNERTGKVRKAMPWSAEVKVQKGKGHVRYVLQLGR